MADRTEELRRDIEQTRRNLGRDVDALSEKVDPRRVVGRRVESARGGVSRVRDRVMGTTSSAASSVQESMHDVGSRAGDVVQSAGDVVQGAPEAVRSKTQGSPLAAGLLAFAAGWVVSSLVPASGREKQLAGAVQDKTADAVDVVKEQATEAAQEMRDNLREPAQQAVQQVRETTTEAVSEVADEGRSAARDVADETRTSAENLRQHDRPSGGYAQ